MIVKQVSPTLVGLYMCVNIINIATAKITKTYSVASQHTMEKGREATVSVAHSSYNVLAIIIIARKYAVIVKYR